MKTASLAQLFERRSSSWALRVLSHVLFWVVVFTSSFYFVQLSFDPYRDTALSYLTPLRSTLGVVLVYYPLMYWLIPSLLDDKKWGKFLLYFALLIGAFILFEAVAEKAIFAYCAECVATAEQINPDYLSVIQKGIIDNILFKGSQVGLYFNLVSGLILPFAIKNSLGYYRAYAQNLQYAKDKVQLELNFLKAQVNPHFLFNTLNNLYGTIIGERNEQSAEIVTRLSDFMRYSLQNVDRKTIALSAEIELINNYIELEKIRMNHAEVTFTCNVQNGTHEIPPLLFIPLLENAFKYAIDKPDTQIEISMTEQQETLDFTIQNSYNAVRKPNDSGGFGLSNLKKRLDLYYPEKYSLDTSKDGSIYRAELKFNLS